MNFFDGGWMLLVVVALWMLVYVPTWGLKSEGKEKNELSTKSRNSFSRGRGTAKIAANGVSNLGIRNKNIRALRAIFWVVSLAAVAAIGYGVMQSFTNPIALTISAIALAVLLLSVSAIRAGNKKRQEKTSLSEHDKEAQRRRMAYLIRESALIDAKPDELFDERAWSDVALPESLLNRKLGTIETANLAEVVSFEAVKSAAVEKKLESEELNLILQRRRATK